MPADHQKNRQRQHEVQIADDRSLLSKLGIEDRAEIKAHLLADNFSGPLHRDEDEAHHHSHRQPEGHLPADAQAPSARSFPEAAPARLTADIIPTARISASITRTRRGIRALPKSGANSIIPATRKKTSTNTGTDLSRLSHIFVMRTIW